MIEFCDRDKLAAFVVSVNAPVCVVFVTRFGPYVTRMFLDTNGWFDMKCVKQEDVALQICRR